MKASRICILAIVGLVTLGSLSKCGDDTPAPATDYSSERIPSKSIAAAPNSQGAPLPKESPTASSEVEQTNEFTDEVDATSRCDRPFRSRYEEVISQGVPRPSLVPNAKAAFDKAANAKGVEATLRLFQGLVITEETQGVPAAKVLFGAFVKHAGEDLAPTAKRVMLPTPSTPCV